MDDLEKQLGSILGDPKMMQQIMSMAQAMRDGNDAPPPPRQEPPLPDIDVATLQRISRLAGSSSIDKREQALLRALSAYLSKERIGKLEKAMRAAKLAKTASVAMAQNRQGG